MNTSAPWVKYYKELQIMFGQDKEIKIKFDATAMEVKLYVDNDRKADALAKILPPEKKLGNITLKIIIIPANTLTKALYLRAFEGNPVLTDVIEKIGATYVQFARSVIQFFNDEISDPNGNITMLYQDIAKDLFVESPETVFYCTSTANPKPQATKEEVELWEKYNGKGSFSDGSKLDNRPF